MHRPTGAPARGIERYLYDYEFHIRRSLKRVYDGNKFSPSGMQKRQWANICSLHCRRPAVDIKSFHHDWSTIDDRRANAACLYEQFRARVWGLGYLRGQLSADYHELYHLTFASSADRRPSGDLARFNLPRYRRRIRSALQELQGVHPGMWAFGMVEISATGNLADGYVFEPHIHLLINGVPKDALRETLEALLPRTTKGSHPIMIKPVPDQDNLGSGLSYFLKFAPELRTKFLTAEGRAGKGRTNLMQGNLKTEWLAWLAAHRIDELLIVIGLRPEIMRQFRLCELQHLIEELP